MKYASGHEVLNSTFRYLEHVLNGEIVDHDGFIGRTARLAEAEAGCPNRERAERDEEGEQ